MTVPLEESDGTVQLTKSQNDQTISTGLKPALQTLSMLKKMSPMALLDSMPMQRSLS